jgi:HNH endonuclease
MGQGEENMRRKRREFSLADRIAIRGRASDASGRVHCERCGRWCPKKADYQIDHVIPEGLRPAADLGRKLTPADGQLLCVAVCHPEKTKGDKGDIGKAVRLEAAHLGVSTPPARKINWGARKEPKPAVTKIANGKSRIAREYGQ